MQAVGWTSGAELAWREPLGVAETPAEYVLHRPRLYLETTIPSYLTARMSGDLHTARCQRTTLRWWNSWRTSFEIYVSDLVAAEVARGNPEAAQRRIDLIDPYAFVMTDERSKALKSCLMADCGLPTRAETDAGHVAVAAVHSIQFLLTWNCAHLANDQFSRRIAAVCQSEGYKCPIICTPAQLLERYEHGLTE
jgi:hypothetical protein